MKLSFFTASLARYPLEKCFQVAADCQFEGVEIWGGRPHAFAPDLKDGDINHLNQLAKDYNLPIIAFEPEQPVHPYSIMHRNEKWRKESMEYFRICLEMTKAMNANLMVMAPQHPGYGTDGEENWKIMIEGLHELAEFAEKIGTILCLETITQYEGNLLTRADDLVRAMRELKSPNVKGMLDLVAPLTMAEPASEYFEKLGADMIHIHLVDGNINHEDHLIAGDGVIPFVETLEMIDSYGYQGYGSLEIFQEYRIDPVLFTKKAVRAVRECQAQMNK